MNINFTKESLLAAIAKIDENPQLKIGRNSSTYNLVYQGKNYPPILVLSVASQIKGGMEIKLEDFNNNTDTPFKILRDNGFEILKKKDVILNKKEEFKIWVLRTLSKNSGAGQAYITSLDWLSERFFENNKINEKSIFEIYDIELLKSLHKETKQIQRNKNSYIYNSVAPSYGERYFYSASIAKYIEFLQAGTLIDRAERNIKFDVKSYGYDLFNYGLIFNIQVLLRFTASLLTKPFVILTGLSGSGKTKLAQAFVQWICKDKNQYRLVPVGADWTNREPLLGYPNALKHDEYVKPDSGVLQLMIKAIENPELPYFLILDEMNLSHVERYFADFLSVMESKDEITLHSENKEIQNVPPKLKVPSNFFIIGTVNIDETTNMFSPKVLDRANTIEFRVTQTEMEFFLSNIKEINLEALSSKGADMAKSFLEMAMNRDFDFKDSESVNIELINFFGELKKAGAEFGYRSATEILRLIKQLTFLDSELEQEEMIDIAIMQKLLPKLHGSRRKLVPVLEKLGSFCVNQNLNIAKDVFGQDNFDFEDKEKVKYPLSLEKIARMHRSAIEHGFASFAEA
jgi:5-methylcytosine-specific restriction protein B